MVWKIGPRVYHGGDYYLLLNVPPNASDDEIIKSFRRLALIFHSDKTHGCSEMFMKLEEAKRILLDPESRREYDRERDNSSDPKLYCMFGSKSKTNKTSHGTPSLKCGFQLSRDLKYNLAKWRKMYRNLDLNGIDDNVELSLLNAFLKSETVVSDEMKKLYEFGRQYFCSICERNFSSEDEHYELMMAGYSDWILDVNDNKNSDSSDHGQIVFAVLRRQFDYEAKMSSDVGHTSPSNKRFCWTEGMFKCQFQVLNDLVEENDFERTNAISFGILMEIEKIVHVNEGRAEELETCFSYLTQLIEARFKNDGYTALSGYRAMFQTFPDFMTHPQGERIHQFIISKLFEGDGLSSYLKCVGGLHFLLWKYDSNSDDSTNTGTEFVNQMDTFSEKSKSLIHSIVNECFNNIDFETLSKLLQILLTCNITVLGECLRKKTSLFNIDMDTDSDYEKIRGEYKPMFLMIRGTMSKLQQKYKEAQCQLASALDCCSDVHFQYRDIIPEAIARLMIDYEFHTFIVSRLIQYRHDNQELIPDLHELPELRKLNIWNQQSRRSISYNVAKLNEEKIRSRFSSKGYLEKAFAFLDFAQGLDLLSGKLLAIIHVIQYLIAEISVQNKLQELFALKNAVDKYSSLIFYMANTSSPPDTKMYVNRFVVATQVKLGLTLNGKINEMKSLIGIETSTEDTKVPIMSKVCLQFLNHSLVEVLRMSKIFPFTTTPLLSVQDHVLSVPPSRSFLQHFIVQKSNISTSCEIFPPHIYAHEKLDAMWRGWGNEDILKNFEICRLEAMEQFLATRSWNFDDVEDLTCWPMLRRTDDGWLNNEEWNLRFEESETVFKTFFGFDLNMKTGEVVFHMIPAENDFDGLFTPNDVADVLEGGISDAYFTLEDPDLQFRIHPFQEFSYHPPSLKETDYLMTMLHADYFLKQITTGIEVNGLAPQFCTRPSSDGFLQRYSPELEAILRPVMERVREPINPFSENAHRFWIEAGKVQVNVTDGTGDWMKFDLKSPEMMVKTKKMKKLSNGKLVDDLEATAHTAEQQLADNMTKYYDEIGQKFPLLHRLKELTKMSAMCDILKNKASFYMGLKDALQNCKSVSDAVSEYISKHESGIRDSIIDFRSKLTAENPFPIYSESRVQQEYQKILAANNLQGQEYRIIPSEITRVKANITMHLHGADQRRVQNCVDQLFQAYDLSNMSTIIQKFLAGELTASETIVVECQKNWRVKELNRINTFLLGLQQSIDLSKSEFNGLKNDPKICSWVPATFCNDFKPPVEYEFELLEHEDEKQNRIPKHQQADVKTSKMEDQLEKIISSQANLAIDDKQAKSTPEQVPPAPTSESNSTQFDASSSHLEDEKEEEDEAEAEQDVKEAKVNYSKPPRVYGGINLSTVLEIVSFIPIFKGVKALKTVAKVAKRSTKRSRAGRTKRIKEIKNDPKTSKSHKGWIQQEENQIERGKRKYIRNPLGTDMAHPRGKESAKGHDYSETFFQERGLHRLQHKHDNMGKLNKPK